MPLPTSEQIAKWTEQGKQAYLREYGTPEAIHSRVKEIVGDTVIRQVIAHALGLKWDRWDSYSIVWNDFEKGAIYQHISPLINKTLAEVLKDYKPVLTAKDILSIRAAYHRSYIERLRDQATARGAADAENTIDAVLQKTLEK